MRTGFARMTVLALAVLGGCSTPQVMAPRAGVAPAVAANAGQDGDKLWQLVQLCVQNAPVSPPKPCAEVSIASGIDSGFAVLKDNRGATQFLVLPTRKVTGIEDPLLLAPGATDYFGAAWEQRSRVVALLQAPLSRDDLSIAVNSLGGRTQNQLHLHIDCLRIDIRDRLRGVIGTLGTNWTALKLDGHDFRAIRIDGDTLPSDPFVTLATGLGVPASEMAQWTLVLVGEDFPGGAPGFVLLAARAAPGYNASGEDLQDHACTGRPARSVG